MKTEYKRNLQNNYLIIEASAKAQEEDYPLRMVEQNEISGLLPMHSSKKDGKLYFHYEITSRQSFSNLYERKALKYQDIIFLLSEVRDMLDILQKFLIAPSHLIFHPDYIYLGAEREKMYFCYYPDVPEEFTITVLAEFILKKLDHEDRQAVTLGYGFYQKASEENFSLRQTLREMLSDAVSQEIKGTQTKENDREKENGAASPDASEDFSYEVIHKERKKIPEVEKQEEDRKEQGRKKIEKLFQLVHPVVLISAILISVLPGILFCLNITDLTQSGGMFFVLVSVEVLINRFWKSSKEKKKKEQNRWTDDEEELYRLLQEEMYQHTDESDEDMKQSSIEETKFLIPEEKRDGIRLVCTDREKSFGNFPDIYVCREPVFIGKIKGESDIILDSPTVSRMHARLEKRDGMYYVKDLNSKNGTFLNGNRMAGQEQRIFRKGDRISFADIEYLVSGP